MKTTVEILKAAKELLVTKGWTQGASARDAEGRKTLTYASAATCFCSFGAVRRASGAARDTGARWGAYEALDAVSGKMGMIAFNDTPGRTLPEVLAKFDEAIAAEEATLAE